jgi:hypothetical protein
MTAKLPIAKWHGELSLGALKVPCSVLVDGRSVVSLSETMQTIAGNRNLKPRDILGVEGLKSSLPHDFLPRESVRFLIPQNNTEAIGLNAEALIDICNAYVDASLAGALRTDRQREIARKCGVVIRACSKVGIVALVHEATGYQKDRAPDALQVLLAAYVSDAEREWAKTFPDTLWKEFRRLAGTKYRNSPNPREFGKLVKHQVYGTLEPDVVAWLEVNRPNPSKGHNWHQSLTEFGTRKLRDHISEIIGIAKTCYSLRDFKERVAEAFSPKPAQKRLPLRERRAA